jgi:hypothetical protein
MENFLYGMIAGIGITIITLITISHYLFPTKKEDDNQWEP